jgi:hypothetical protein
VERVRGLILALVGVFLLVAGAASAQPTPGGNGEIAFARNGELFSFDPRTGTSRDVGPGAQPAWSSQHGLASVRDETIYVDGVAVTNGIWPAWSPDGARLVFARYDGKPTPQSQRGTLELYVLDWETRDVRQLTSGSGGIVLPSWSPDGKRIGFGAVGGLWTLAVDEPDAVPVRIPIEQHVSGGLSWSPDGTRFAFVGDNGQVDIANADGTGLRQLTLTLVHPAAGTQERPAWSPDGGYIAWAQGADICVTDLAGGVARLTHSTAAAAASSLPDWQSVAGASAPIVGEKATPADAPSCDLRPGARVDVMPGNVSPRVVSLKAPQPIAFVNRLAVPVTVTATLNRAKAVVQPGDFLALATTPGDFEFTVTGYPDGVPRSGSFEVEAAGRTSIDAHAPIRYGAKTTLSGVASGTTGAVTISARPFGSKTSHRVATVQPVGGRWTLSVAPRITTSYSVSFGGATTQRLLRVMPTLHVTRAGSVAQAVLTPAAALRGKRLYLFRANGTAWTQSRAVRIDARGRAVFAKLVPGRYYAGFPGGDDYWGTASEPFAVGR